MIMTADRALSPIVIPTKLNARYRDLVTNLPGPSLSQPSPGRLVTFAFLFLGLAFVTPTEAQWSANGVPVCIASNGQYLPAIATDGSGGAIICWGDGRPGLGEADIYAQRIDGMGTPQWQPNGVLVCSAPRSQGGCSIVADGSGGAIIFWSDSRAAEFFYDIYAQRLNANGESEWAPNGVPICTAARTQELPLTVADGAGGAIVVWQDERIQDHYDLFMQRVNGAGVPLWASDGVPVTSSSTGAKFYASVSSDQAGGVLVTWTEGRSDETESDIYVQKINGTGLSYWDAEGVAVCTAYHLQYSGDIVPDGAGGAIAVWDDCRATWFGDCYYSDIYAQRVDAAGATQWAENGIPITYTLPHESNSRVVSDGHGGAIISWDLEYDDIFAQRINASGAFLWTPSGVPICTLPGAQYDNTLIADGIGGAIIAWNDDVPNLNDNVGASRINASGQPLWGSNGVAVTVAPGEQQWPVLVSDGWGGAIFAWQDNRSGVNTDDIYAQRVTGAGAIPTAVRDASPPAFAMSEFAPNPSSGRATTQLSLDRESDVTLQIYDAAGRLISASRGSFATGTHQLEFDGTDGNGRRLPSGVYFARVTADGSSITRKMIIVR